MQRTMLSLLILTGAAYLLAAGPIAKQLAGPPSEFGQMSAVDPGLVGIRSKSAMIPVFLEQQGDGSWSWNGEVAVEDGRRFEMLVFGGQSMDWDLQMSQAGMKRPLSVNELMYEVRETEFGLEENKVPATFYGFEEIQTGSWQLRVQTPALQAKANPAAPDGYIMFSSESPWRLYAHLTESKLWIGNEIGFAAFGFDSRNYRDMVVPVAAPVLENVQLRITAPSGEVSVYSMLDNGTAADGGQNDGVFGATFMPMETGQYSAQIIARGLLPNGKAFFRTAEQTFPVIAPDLELVGNRVDTRITDDLRLSLDIPVELYEEAVGRYRTLAEVWGRDQEGSAIAIAWVGGITEAIDGNLSLGLDTRWIANAGAQGPFELRNIRIETLDGYVPVATAAVMDLNIESFPAGMQRSKTITEDMLMGIRPEIASNKRAGSRLLLVHGYCSGDVWGGNLGNFTSASLFKDLNQNRSHDAFAQRIQTFGNSWTSYGIVAHSQGGAASLHLYTYYWSGLDNASGNRLIQSVGTPYQGTALAGNLAALGEVFGAGCGTNNDLTYSGSSSWLSGIPTWARNKVNYFTTSFTDVWWRYDYCHLATDLFLSDPEDGTTEKTYGQLPSGVNQGHKTGWCHTNSMRDPGQCTDSSRNSSMNSNAAR